MINFRNYILLLILLLPSLSHADNDPFEDINKKTHNLNQTLDLQVASPVARFYKRITPDILEIDITQTEVMRLIYCIEKNRSWHGLKEKIKN